MPFELWKELIDSSNSKFVFRKNNRTFSRGDLKCESYIGKDVYIVWQIIGAFWLFQLSLATLRDRLYWAQGNTDMTQAPARPFQVIDIQAEGVARQVQQPQQPQVQPQQVKPEPGQRQRTNSGYYQVWSGNHGIQKTKLLTWSQILQSSNSKYSCPCAWCNPKSRG